MKPLIFFIFMVLVAGAAKLAPSHRVAPSGVKNLVLVIGDGMGLSQASVGLYSGAEKGQLEFFPVVGLQKTYSADNLVTDSAAAGTAMACGKKTKNNYIGMDEKGVACKSILEEAEVNGFASGLVVTSSVVHATPASFVAHQPSRNLYENIAEDFLQSDIDLFIGGGKQFFDRRDKDDRNLVKELEAKNYAVFNYFRDDLLKVIPQNDKGFVFFTADNQPLPAVQGRDYLPFAVNNALKYLSQRSDKGFFLLVEGSQIDWACHANQGEALLSEMGDFNRTLQTILEFAKQDGQTLVVVTADHETGGLAINDGSQIGKLDLRFTTNGHTATMVPVYAFGPQSDLFRGIYENTAIFKKMKQALGLYQE